MEYLYAFLLLVVIVFLTTILTGMLKILVPIAYLGLGFYLGTESLIVGIGASLGAIVNILLVGRYLRTQGAMSSAPFYSRLASYGLIIAFIIGLFFKNSTELDSGDKMEILFSNHEEKIKLLATTDENINQRAIEISVSHFRAESAIGNELNNPNKLSLLKQVGFYVCLKASEFISPADIIGESECR